MHREQIEDDRMRETSFSRTINRYEKPRVIETIKKLIPSEIIALFQTEEEEKKASE